MKHKKKNIVLFIFLIMCFLLPKEVLANRLLTEDEIASFRDGAVLPSLASNTGVYREHIDIDREICEVLDGGWRWQNNLGCFCWSRTICWNALVEHQRSIDSRWRPSHVPSDFPDGFPIPPPLPLSEQSTPPPANNATPPANNATPPASVVDMPVATASDNSDYNSLCNDPGLAVTLSIIQDFMAILQIAVPIILMLMAAIEFSKLMINPDEKKGKKGIILKCAAAVSFFLLPFTVDLGMSMTEANFNVSGCWELARTRGREIRDNDSEWEFFE